jgi:hypothetical protein
VRPFFQRFAIGQDRLFEPRGAALALPERLKRSAEIVLRRSPSERHALARPFLERNPAMTSHSSQRAQNSQA